MDIKKRESAAYYFAWITIYILILSIFSAYWFPSILSEIVRLLTGVFSFWMGYLIYKSFQYGRYGFYRCYSVPLFRWERYCFFAFTLVIMVLCLVSISWTIFGKTIPWYLIIGQLKYWFHQSIQEIFQYASYYIITLKVHIKHVPWTIIIGVFTIIINFWIYRRNRVQIYKQELYKKKIEAYTAIINELDDLCDLIIDYYHDNKWDSADKAIFDKNDCKKIEEVTKNKADQLIKSVKTHRLFIPKQVFHRLQNIINLYYIFIVSLLQNGFLVQ